MTVELMAGNIRIQFSAEAIDCRVIGNDGPVVRDALSNISLINALLDLYKIQHEAHKRKSETGKRVDAVVIPLMKQSIREDSVERRRGERRQRRSTS